MSRFSAQNHFPQEVDPVLTLLEIHFGLGQISWHLKPQLGYFLALQMRKQAQGCWLIVCPALTPTLMLLSEQSSPAGGSKEWWNLSFIYLGPPVIFPWKIISFSEQQRRIVSLCNSSPISTVWWVFFLRLFLHICITLQFAKHSYTLWCCVYYYIIYINYCNFYICSVLLFSQLCKR